MALVSMNWHPTRKECRQFGEVALAMLTGIALLLSWLKGLPARWALGLCAAGLAVYLLSRVSHRLVRWVYVGLCVLALPVGWVVNHLLMGAFYYGAITPLGLLFRLAGRDPLRRRFDPDAPSYWVRRHPPDSAGRYFQQF